jgi:phage/plasmid-associated DNA primase
MAEKEIKSILKKLFAGEFNDDSIAKLFYLQYPTKLIYDLDNKKWYSINQYGIYKNENNELQTARLLIATQLKDFISDTYWKEYKKSSVEKQLIMAKVFSKLIKFICTEKNKTNIIDAMKKYYGKENIYSSMDNVNKYVIGFTNGVWDLQNKCFRNAKPEELVSTTTGYDYKKADLVYIKKLNKILIDIFPVKIERTYVLKTLSLGLLGANILEEFYIWMATNDNNQGANGKSLLEALIDSTFGDYCKTMDVDFLTTSNHAVSANAPNEILASLKNARIVFINEIGKNTTLNDKKLKMLTGRDKVSCRALHSHIFEYYPKYSLFALTNFDLKINGADKALARRPKKHLFRNQFVDKPTLSFHRQINRNLKEEFMNNIAYRTALFEILVDHYNMFPVDENNEIIGVIDVPKSVTDATSKFLNNNNAIKEFINNKLDITKNDKDIISSSELYKIFVAYFEGDSKQVTTAEFKNELVVNDIKFKKTSSCNVFVGVKIKVTPVLNVENINFLEDESEEENEEEDEEILEITDIVDDYETELKQLQSIQINKININKECKKIAEIDKLLLDKPEITWGNGTYTLDLGADFDEI